METETWQEEQVCGKNHEEQELGLGPGNFEVPIRSSRQLATGIWRLRKGSGMQTDLGAIRLLGGI